MNKMIWVWMALGMSILAWANYLAALAWLDKRKEKIVYLLMGLRLPRYLNRYGVLTREETGRTGIHFYGFIICINLSLAAFLVFLIA